MNASRPVAVTGAGGFIGEAVVRHLRREGWKVRPVVRGARAGDPDGALALGDLATVDEHALADLLSDVEAILHFAGRAHVSDRAQDDDAYHADNVVSTRRLAVAAARAGVKRFVLASTVKVNGEFTLAGRRFAPGDPTDAKDAYARSKRDAEAALIEVSGAMAPITLRLPLTYGPGARGNFARLVRAIAAGHALPLGAIDNRRSLLSLRNLASAITAILRSSAPPVGIHFVADANSVSTPELARAIGRALGHPAKLYAMPVALLRAAGAVSGRANQVARLVDSLEVDTSSLAVATGWRPAPFAIEPGDVAGVAVER